MSLLRRTRGVLGTALTWSIGWALALPTMGLVAWVLFPPAPGVRRVPSTGGGFLRAGLAGALWGAVAGAVFAGLVYAAARRRGGYRFARTHAVVFGALSGGALSALLLAAVEAIGGSIRGIAPQAMLLPPLLGSLIGVAYGVVAGGANTQEANDAARRHPRARS